MIHPQNVSSQDFISFKRFILQTFCPWLVCPCNLACKEGFNLGSYNPGF
jgi:hypothetical protein